MKRNEDEHELGEREWFAASDEDRCSECSDEYDSTDDQLKLDLEVKRFLEVESYRVNDTRRRLALLQAEDTVVLDEESLFAGVNEPIGAPDLGDSTSALIEELRQYATFDTREAMTTETDKVFLTPSNAVTSLDTSQDERPKKSEHGPAFLLRYQLEPGMHYKGRRTVKDQLDFLRQYVKHLEDELAELKFAQVLDEGNAKSTAMNKEVVEEEKVQTSQAQLWERIAEQQWDEQQRAIERNAKLKELLEWQLKIVHNLSKAIRKRPFPTCELAHFASKHARKTQRRVVHASMTTPELLGALPWEPSEHAQKIP